MPIKGLNIKSLVVVTNAERRTDQFNSAVRGIAMQNANLPVVNLSNASTLTLSIPILLRMILPWVNHIK